METCILALEILELISVLLDSLNFTFASASAVNLLDTKKICYNSPSMFSKNKLHSSPLLDSSPCDLSFFIWYSVKIGTGCNFQL